MENTINNKQKFFAQYWGQKVFKFPNTADYEINEITRNVFQEVYKNGYLELTPLSSISDEDAIEVAKIIFQEDSAHIFREDENERIYLKGEKEYAYLWYDGEILFEQSDVQSPICLLGAYDYMRSKSVGLPFNGLSVEQQIEYGWVKLKTE